MPVEDHARVGAALVLLDEVDDRVAPDLLLAVARDADVHGELGVLRQELRRLDERVQLALVVGDPATVVPAVALRELEGRRLPQVERRGRLHVEVAVDQDGRRAPVAGRGRDLPQDELALAERRHLRLPAGALDEVGKPLRRAHNVVAVRRVRAHRRDRDELAQFVEPRLLHGAELYGKGEPPRREAALTKRLRR